MSPSELPRYLSVADLPRAHGPPLGRGRTRARPEDFEVEEILGFSPDGDGAHRLLWVRKTGANTEWVARRLAGHLGVPVSAVGYAGLKDRHAVTYQWFSVPSPPQAAPDWSELAPLGIEVLDEHAHRRKLRRGAHRANRFRIRIRDFFPDPKGLRERLTLIGDYGVPNYFGEQRFGREEGNLRGAHALLTGTAGRVARHQRGLWLSAARAQLFNEVLAERVRGGDWDRPRPGDCLQLDGTRSFFLAEVVDDQVGERARRMDLHPTGPLWGRGEPPSRGEVAALESRIGAGLAPWPDGLGKSGLEQERRALRLPVRDLTAVEDEEGLLLELVLPAGAFATVVLRELLDHG